MSIASPARVACRQVFRTRGEAPAGERVALMQGSLRSPMRRCSPLRHNNSGGDAGLGNAAPDQVESWRKTAEYFSDSLLGWPQMAPLSRLVWSLV
jgi:hypothetical protein